MSLERSKQVLYPSLPKVILIYVKTQEFPGINRDASA
ncbi:hypothetical protein TOL_1355 [Thalassolituus oleivorans MIL-1]|uniref:Uncharacterized protein n=1 Tax=Thalassolituus oleivorans MIL-1 TaxID=1298593 RepID=M5DPA5_9GAMM|nr:hypothetical protein TOL_1355 [Thalassolituus oleivorans MIL-1]